MKPTRISLRRCGNAGIMASWMPSPSGPGEAAPLSGARLRDRCRAAAPTSAVADREQGFFGPKGEAKARAIYKKACDADVADALLRAVERQLIDGKGGPKDAVLAKTLFDKACKAGSKNAVASTKRSFRGSPPTMPAELDRHPRSPIPERGVARAGDVPVGADALATGIAARAISWIEQQARRWRHGRGLSRHRSRARSTWSRSRSCRRASTPA